MAVFNIELSQVEEEMELKWSLLALKGENKTLFVKMTYFLFKRIMGTTNFFHMYVKINYVEEASVNQKSKFTLVIKFLVIQMSITLHLQ